MMADEIWGPLGVILGVLGIIVAAVVAWWFARGPRLVMQASGTTLVSTPSDDRIAVLYKGEPVPRVTQTIVWLWREGRGTVRGSDIVDDDPIVLCVPPDDRILDAGLLSQSKPTNAVAVAFDASNPDAGASVGFAYLDPRQGAVIEVVHTAESPESVDVRGTIVGIPKGIVRVTGGVEVELPVGLAGAVSVTVPTHTIPRSLRVASGERTSKQVDLTLSGIVANALRRLLS
jgi:hypothetical protein